MLILRATKIRRVSQMEKVNKELELKPATMNIYQKIQKCKCELGKADLKKSGKNTYSNYNYYELGDFLPKINDVMDKYGLTAIFNFKEDLASLTVVNCENPSETLYFSTPISIATLKGTYAIQNIGATQTYARRYLYVMAFEIAESDVLDEKEHDEDLIERGQKINKVRAASINAMLEQTGADVKGFLRYYKLKEIEDITNDLFLDIMAELQKKLEKVKKAPLPEVGKNKVPDLGM